MIETTFLLEKISERVLGLPPSDFTEVNQDTYLDESDYEGAKVFSHEPHRVFLSDNYEVWISETRVSVVSVSPHDDDIYECLFDTDRVILERDLDWTEKA